jgi:hypothetical protein
MSEAMVKALITFDEHVWPLIWHITSLFLAWMLYEISPLSREMLIIATVRKFNDVCDVRLYSDKIREFAYDADVSEVITLSGSVWNVYLQLLLRWSFGITTTLPMSLVREGLGPKFDIPDLADQLAFERLCTIGKLSPMFNIPISDISNDWQRGTIDVCWQVIRMRRLIALENSANRRTSGPGSFAQLN